MSWLPNPLAILSEPWQGRPGCNYCGQCAHGCPRTDKGSADVTFVAQAQASGRCTVLAQCHVTAIVHGDGDRVARVGWVDADGTEHSLRPRAAARLRGGADASLVAGQRQCPCTARSGQRVRSGRPQFHGNPGLGQQRPAPGRPGQPPRRAVERHLLGFQRSGCHSRYPGRRALQCRHGGNGLGRTHQLCTQGGQWLGARASCGHAQQLWSGSSGGVHRRVSTQRRHLYRPRLACS
ncbi:MAG TPA: GMC family oxidoreductase N-terminal domain-containing protein [Accumulibacter sp.]|nr:MULTISPECIES: GMC family oxidoreductase N-terminal domain-containing protein [Candidatus Accumulibacter]MCQ1551201.1 GMC family oxidoreductase N-terminal domain-containing protein [Candidatus Accumulibacter phosphatis]HNC22402.1 GMC family oxidoreductase N-terminal domain-containing protein [Accumulibacter sp.]HNF91760.1 GMC family oxidoreductase N-terminal domain-containing protein [Accumulibacter sp.]